MPTTHTHAPHSYAHTYTHAHHSNMPRALDMFLSVNGRNLRKLASFIPKTTTTPSRPRLLAGTPDKAVQAEDQGGGGGGGGQQQQQRPEPDAMEALEAQQDAGLATTVLAAATLAAAIAAYLRDRQGWLRRQVWLGGGGGAFEAVAGAGQSCSRWKQALETLATRPVGLCAHPCVGLCAHPCVGLCAHPCVGLCTHPCVGLCAHPCFPYLPPPLACFPLCLLRPHPSPGLPPRYRWSRRVRAVLCMAGCSTPWSGRGGAGARRQRSSR